MKLAHSPRASYISLVNFANQGLLTLSELATHHPPGAGPGGRSAHRRLRPGAGAPPGLAGLVAAPGQRRSAELRHAAHNVEGGVVKGHQPKP